jgi:ribosomal protein S18 acetylase RimI-like enzyme
MRQSRPAIRPARSEDAGFIARTILSAQRGHRPWGWFDITLGWPEPQVVAFVERMAIARTRSWWHVANFIIAEIAGEPAASLCAMPAAGSGVAARAAFAEVAGDIGLGPAELSAIFSRAAYARECWIQGSDEDWLIEHVATDPACRGRGLVQALIDHALAAGKAAGHTQASISFLIGNEAAERCYAKAGFAFAEEKRDPAFEALTGAPGFRRSVRAIQ